MEIVKLRLISKKLMNIKLMREKSQPLKTKTSGSTFKNPKNNFAAKLIERCQVVKA